MPQPQHRGSKAAERFGPWVTALVLLGVWQLCPLFLDEAKARLFPTPLSLWELIKSPDALSGGFTGDQSPWGLLARFSWNSLWRVVAGVMLAGLIAYPLGLLLGLSPLATVCISPALRWFGALSPVAWLPLGMLLIPQDNSLAVFLVIISVVFPMTLATANAVSGVDPELLELARSLGATRWQRIIRVSIPASFPACFFTVRLSLLGAWMAVLIAEVVGLERQNWGLGSLVWQGRQSANFTVVVFGMVCMASLGVLLDRLLAKSQTLLLWWRDATINS